MKKALLSLALLTASSVAAPAAFFYSFTETPNIPPTGDPWVDLGNNTYSINVGVGGYIQDLSFAMSLFHSASGDGVVSITSPSLTTVEVVNPQSVTNQNFNDYGIDLTGVGLGLVPGTYEFADSASISHFDFFDTVGTGIAANTIVSGTYQPANPLAAFLGESATGIWTISFDDTAPGDSGQVFNLELNIAIPEPSRALLLCLGLVGLVLRRQR